MDVHYHIYLRSESNLNDNYVCYSNEKVREPNQAT
jgi:hypothetical protein